LIVDVSNDGPCYVVCQGNIIFADEKDMDFQAYFILMNYGKLIIGEEGD